MPAKKWSKQRVMEAIQERQRLGLPLSTAWKNDKRLYTAANVQFGGWQKALLAMNVFGARPHEKW